MYEYLLHWIMENIVDEGSAVIKVLLFLSNTYPLLTLPSLLCQVIVFKSTGVVYVNNILTQPPFSACKFFSLLLLCFRYLLYIVVQILLSSIAIEKN